MRVAKILVWFWPWLWSEEPNPAAPEGTTGKQPLNERDRSESEIDH